MRVVKDKIGVRLGLNNIWLDEGQITVEEFG